VSLTDAQIKAFKPKATRYLKTDGRGLSLDVLPSGVRSWIFRYRLNGKQEKVALGHYPDMGLGAARKERDRLAQIVVKGKSPAREKMLARGGRATDPTMRSFADRYYDEQVKPNLKDPSEVRRYLDNEIFPYLGERLLKDVGVLDCQQLIYRKRDKGRITTALHLRATLKQIFDYALELQLVAANPAAQVATKYIGKSRKRTRALSPSELRSFLRTIYASDIQRQFKLAVHVTLLTLTRKSELRLAEWEPYVNLEAGEWIIPAQNTKTNAEHIVYLSTQVAEMFRELQVLACGSPYVLPGKSSLRKPLHENSLNAALDRLTFDIPDFTIHDLRRTASTILHGNHFQPDVIEVALGHKVAGIRGVYNVAEYAAERKRMLQWWADYVDSIVNESKLVIGNFGTDPIGYSAS
jgi:integrase